MTGPEHCPHLSPGPWQYFAVLLGEVSVLSVEASDVLCTQRLSCHLCVFGTHCCFIQPLPIQPGIFCFKSPAFITRGPRSRTCERGEREMGFLVPSLLISPEQWSLQHFTISLLSNFQKVRHKSGENLKDLFLEANLFVNVSGFGGENTGNFL